MTIRRFLGLVLIVVILTSCTQTKINDGGEVESRVIRVELSERSEEGYLFQLESDVLKVTKGIRGLIDIEDEDLIEKERYGELRLSEDQSTELWSLVDQLEFFDSRETIVFGAWVVKAAMGDRRVETTYGIAEDKELDELVTKLIEISPIEIIDELLGKTVMPTTVN